MTDERPTAANDAGVSMSLSKGHAAENDALAGEVWQEADNVLLLCVIPGQVWQDFNGQRFAWDTPTVARPLRRLLDRAGNLAPERVIPPGSCEETP